jgi:biopolymer transport protein ExbD
LDWIEAKQSGDEVMAGSLSTELKAEPNLTPLLDVVFQLITFFMLVMNFSNENYDQRVRLPMAGSARPIDDEKQVSEDRLVLNIDQDGHLLFGGEVQPLNKAIQTIKHQADLIKINLKAAGLKPDSTGGLPTTIMLRADKDTNFSSVLNVIKACQSNGFRKFALKAMSRG